MTVLDFPLHQRTTAYVVQCVDGCRCHSGSFRSRPRANHWAIQADVLCAKGPHQVRPVAPAKPAGEAS